ncbi:hypothetical protein J6590_009115 [Homalodisca vitripennis]|nr:hypothetical protein J6590_009115 [Homalodisca vitripennis]
MSMWSNKPCGELTKSDRVLWRHFQSAREQKKARVDEMRCGSGREGRRRAGSVLASMASLTIISTSQKPEHGRGEKRAGGPDGKRRGREQWNVGPGEMTGNPGIAPEEPIYKHINTMEARRLAAIAGFSTICLSARVSSRKSVHNAVMPPPHPHPVFLVLLTSRQSSPCYLSTFTGFYPNSPCGHPPHLHPVFLVLLTSRQSSPFYLSTFTGFYPNSPCGHPPHPHPVFLILLTSRQSSPCYLSTFTGFYPNSPCGHPPHPHFLILLTSRQSSPFYLSTFTGFYPNSPCGHPPHPHPVFLVLLTSQQSSPCYLSIFTVSYQHLPCGYPPPPHLIFLVLFPFRQPSPIYLLEVSLNQFSTNYISIHPILPYPGCTVDS